MQLVHAGRMPWGENLASQRAGRMAHKRLFEGTEGTPDNYLLVLANEGSDYYSPRHRHAWDQVRLCLQGSVPIGRELKIDAGEVGYFPEGVHYGPQEGGPDRIVLLLQFGGASGLGYLSPAQVKSGYDRLRECGAFEQGVFRRTSGDGKKNQDAYEAIWRHVTGHELHYPAAAYRAPVILRPGGFAWRALAGCPGVRRKLLASFPERGLELEFIALDSGAQYALEPSSLRRFVFVREGTGSCAGEPFFPHSAARLEPGETTSFSAATPSELFVIAVATLAAPPAH